MKVLLPLLISTLIILHSNADGNVTCAGTGMNWYTDHVGETACQTYERLRQICNPRFEVGTMSVGSLTPDVCNDQDTPCCCNSIAFSLAMLCLNCQQDIGTSNGYDAGAGAYGIYLQGNMTSGSCTPVSNQTLDTTVQAAVCNRDIEIFDQLYYLFWGNGAWFFMYTEDRILEYIAAQTNSFTHCTSTSVNNTSSVSLSALSTSTSSSPMPATTSSDDLSSSSLSLSVGAKVGIVFGVISGLAVFAIMMWLLCWKRRFINEPVLLVPWPFNAEKRESYSQPGNPGHVAGYRGRRAKTRNVVPSQPNARPSPSRRRPRMDPSQNANIPLTGSTRLGLSSGSSSPPLGDHSPGQNLEVFTAREPQRDVDAGRVPQEMLVIILPPAYGDQID